MPVVPVAFLVPVWGEEFSSLIFLTPASLSVSYTLSDKLSSFFLLKSDAVDAAGTDPGGLKNNSQRCGRSPKRRLELG